LAPVDIGHHWIQVGTADIVEGCTAQGHTVWIWDEAATHWGLWYTCHHLKQHQSLAEIVWMFVFIYFWERIVFTTFLILSSIITYQ
jgi:hypothetical protein